MLPVMNAMPHNPHRPSRRDVLRLDALGLLSEFAGDLVGIEDPDALLWAVAERTINRLDNVSSTSATRTATSSSKRRPLARRALITKPFSNRLKSP